MTAHRSAPLLAILLLAFLGQTFAQNSSLHFTASPNQYYVLDQAYSQQLSKGMGFQTGLSFEQRVPYAKWFMSSSFGFAPQLATADFSRLSPDTDPNEQLNLFQLDYRAGYLFRLGTCRWQLNYGPGLTYQRNIQQRVRYFSTLVDKEQQQFVNLDGMLQFQFRMGRGQSLTLGYTAGLLGYAHAKSQHQYFQFNITDDPANPGYDLQTEKQVVEKQDQQGQMASVFNNSLISHRWEATYRMRLTNVWSAQAGVGYHFQQIQKPIAPIAIGNLSAALGLGIHF